MENFSELSEILKLLPALIIGVTFHELSHGLVAHYLGDMTPKNHGRLTINPLKHLDPLGSIMLLIVHFGWAKPMPVNPHNFENPRKGMMWVGLAGPVANGLIATVAALLIRTGLFSFSLPIAESLLWIIRINLILGLFNLIPFPPLDGSRILAAYLPTSMQRMYDSLEQYGVFILIIALAVFRFPVFSIISPFLSFFEKILLS